MLFVLTLPDFLFYRGWSLEVTKWLRTMDLIYARTKINEDGTSQLGNQFQQHYPSIIQLGEHWVSHHGPSMEFLWWKLAEDVELLSDRAALYATRDWHQFHCWGTTVHLVPLCQYPTHILLILCRHVSRFIGLKGRLQEDRVASSAEADKAEISQWVLTGTGFWVM